MNKHTRNSKTYENRNIVTKLTRDRRNSQGGEHLIQILLVISRCIARTYSCFLSLREKNAKDEILILQRWKERVKQEAFKPHTTIMLTLAPSCCQHQGFSTCYTTECQLRCLILCSFSHNISFQLPSLNMI